MEIAGPVNIVAMGAEESQARRSIMAKGPKALTHGPEGARSNAETHSQYFAGSFSLRILVFASKEFTLNRKQPLPSIFSKAGSNSIRCIAITC